MLDLSSFSSVTNTIANTTNNGWFAINGGQLKLPTINVTGDGTYVWGGSDHLVNAARLTFSGVSGPGTFDVSVFATDNPLVPSTVSLGHVIARGT